MARFDISEQGAVALKKLARDLLFCADAIIESNSLLLRQISQVEDGLGIYGQEIKEIAGRNRGLLRKNYDMVVTLADLLTRKGDEILDLMTDFGGADLRGTAQFHTTSNSQSRSCGSCRSKSQSSIGGQTYLDKNSFDSQYLKPDGKTPRELPVSRFGYMPDKDGNMLYDSPMEMNEYLCKKQGKAKMTFQGTCGLCSCANILRLAGVNATEDEMIAYAATTRAPNSVKTLCETNHHFFGSNGATSPQDRRLILEHFGISSGVFEIIFDIDGKISNRNIEKIADFVSDGKGVILSIHADMLWYGIPFRTNDYHAVTVISVKKDANGEILGFYLCDTAKGGTKYYTAEKVKNCLTGSEMNVTHQIIR